MARPRLVTNERILEVARDVFIKDGPGVSTAHIALRLGVSQAALFKRFGSKSALMIAALAPPARPAWFALVEGGPSAAPIQDQLVDIGHAISAFFEELGPCLSVLRFSNIDPKDILAHFGDSPPPIVGRRLLTEWLDKAAADGRIAPIDTTAVAMAFVGGLFARLHFEHLAPSAEPRQSATAYVESVVQAIWGGLCPPRAPTGGHDS